MHIPTMSNAILYGFLKKYFIKTSILNKSDYCEGCVFQYMDFGELRADEDPEKCKLIEAQGLINAYPSRFEIGCSKKEEEEQQHFIYKSKLKENLEKL